jgi:hypothetical protein
VRNDCQPGTQLVGLSVDKNSIQVTATRGPAHMKLKNLHCVKGTARKRLVETVTD